MTKKVLRRLIFILVAISSLSASHQLFASDQLKSDCIAVCNDESCWSQNRRAVGEETPYPYRIYPKTVK